MQKTKTKIGMCGYCGSRRQVEKEHIVGRNLFAGSIRSEAKLITINSCKPCNESFTADEEDFRNYAVCAGPDNNEAREIFSGKLLRGIRDPAGRGTHTRLLNKILFKERDGKREAWIYPDEGVLRTVRKFARGLAFHHLGKVVSDSKVHSEALRGTFPKFVDESDDLFHQIHPSTFRYHFETEDMGDMQSGWIFSIFRTRNFVVRIFRSARARDRWLKNRGGAR